MNNFSKRYVRAISLALITLGIGSGAEAISLGSDFETSYNFVDLGNVPGLPSSYGGLAFKLGDPNTLLIGGNANTLAGNLYEIGVVRDSNNHIIGFTDSLNLFGDVGEYNDGGIVYGPDDVLFTAQWPVNNLGQTKLGSTDEDRVDNLSSLGIGGSSISALNFVPTGFGGAGKMKVVSWNSGNWYDVDYSPDGLGTFNLNSATQIDLDPIISGIQPLPGGPEGFVYIDGTNPGFGVDSLLVSDFSSGRISAYEIDSNGDPLVATRRNFITGLNGAEGATIDPLTGDFLFSTFGGGDRVIVASGFNTPDPDPDPDPTSVPEPTSAIGLLVISTLSILNQKKLFKN